MKKIIAAIMLGIMLLSLTACAASPYQELIDMLDNKDYEGAMAYIAALYEANRETDPTAEEVERLQKQYYSALNLLRTYISNDGRTTSTSTQAENGEWIHEQFEYNDARLKIREVFTELGDHGIAQDVVSRFTSTPDLLVKKSVESFNTFGESSSTSSWFYTYDEQGRVTELTRWGEYERYTYDANGNVTEMRKGYDDTTNSVTTYTYDENGNLLEENWQNSSGSTKKTTYTYEEGKIIRKEVQSGDSTPYVYLYTYNEAGQLAGIQREQAYYYYSYDETLYTYDENGNLVKEEYIYWTYNSTDKVMERDEDQTEITTYTYEGSRLVSKSYSDQYGSDTTTYVYGEYCTFDTEGLVIPEA